MKPGLFQILIVLMIIVVLFGRGRISEMMGDFGRGFKSFKKNMTDDDPAPALVEVSEVQPAAETATDNSAS